MSQQDRFDVFLAHNSQDKPLVRAIARQLRNYEVTYWIDEEQIPPGRWFQDIIQAAIRNVKTAAIFFGVNGLGNWQALELRVFIARCVEENVPVIPVFLPGFVGSIPDSLIFLKQLNWVDFRKLQPDPIEQLIWGIKGTKPIPGELDIQPEPKGSFDGRWLDLQANDRLLLNIHDDGTIITGNAPTQHIQHTIEGIHVNDRKANITIIRQSNLDGCTTEMYGRLISSSNPDQIEWVLDGTDGRCEVPKWHKERRIFNRIF